MTHEAVFGLHTAEFKRWISRREADSIKAYFNLNPDEALTGNTYFYQDGITKLWIEEVKGRKPRYYLHVIVNFARALRASNYKAMPYTTGNVRKVFTALNKMLRALPLSDSNAVFQEWTTVRLDSTFDIQEEHTELLMSLLNRSVNLGDRKKRCQRIPIQGKTAEESMSQSLRFGNHSFTYNIYRKIAEIQDKGKNITEEEKADVQHLLRIERQNHQDAVKKLLPNMKASDLSTSKVHDDILKTMIDEMETFFGRGDFYSCKQIEKTCPPEHYTDVRAIRNIMKRITLASLEAAQESYTKEISGIFARLGLSPTGIKKEEAEQYKAEQIQGIYNRITAAYPRPPDKRQYNSFPVPHRTADGRYKATITLYSAHNGRKQVQIAGKTLEDYERKVFNQLILTYLLNHRYIKSDDADQRNMIKKSADSLRRFAKVSKTAAKHKAEEFIESVIMADEKRMSDCPSVADGGLTVSDNPNSN